MSSTPSSPPPPDGWTLLRVAAEQQEIKEKEAENKRWKKAAVDYLIDTFTPPPSAFYEEVDKYRKKKKKIMSPLSPTSSRSSASATSDTNSPLMRVEEVAHFPQQSEDSDSNASSIQHKLVYQPARPSTPPPTPPPSPPPEVEVLWEKVEEGHEAYGEEGKGRRCKFPPKGRALGLLSVLNNENLERSRKLKSKKWLLGVISRIFRSLSKRNEFLKQPKDEQNKKHLVEFMYDEVQHFETLKSLSDLLWYDFLRGLREYSGDCNDCATLIRYICGEWSLKDFAFYLKTRGAEVVEMFEQMVKT